MGYGYSLIDSSSRSGLINLSTLPANIWARDCGRLMWRPLAVRGSSLMPMARKNVEPLLPEPEGDVQRKTLGSLHKCLDGIGMLLYKPDPESGGVCRRA